MPALSVLFDDGGKYFPETITPKSSTYSSFTTPSCHGGWEVMYPSWGWVLFCQEQIQVSISKEEIGEKILNRQPVMSARKKKKSSTKETIIRAL